MNDCGNSGNRRRGRRNRGNKGREKDTQQSGTPQQGGKKFQGLNKEELSGVVISDALQTPLSQQCDSMFEALITCGGKDSPKVKTALKTFEMLPQEHFLPEDPDPKEWTRKDKSDKEVEIDCLREATIKSHASQRTAALEKYQSCVEDVQKLFATILGQLNNGIKDDIKSDDKWTQANRDNDAITLLKTLRDRCCRETSNEVMPAIDLMRKIAACVNSTQDSHMSASTFVETVRARSEVVKAVGASLRSEHLIRHTPKTSLKDKGWDYDKDCLNMSVGGNDVETVHEAVDELAQASIVIEGCHQDNHDKVARHLERQCGTGQDACPKNPNAAHNTLNLHKIKKKSTPSTHNSAQNQRDHTGNKDKTDGHEDGKEKDDDKTPPEDKKPPAEQKTTFVTSGKEAKGEENKKKSKIEEAHQMLMNAQHNQLDGWGFAQLGEEQRTDDVSGMDIMDMNANWRDEDELFNEAEIMPGKSRSATDGAMPTESRSEGVVQARRHETNMIKACMFAQTQGGSINKNWILLDGQASCNVTCNPNLVDNMRKHPNGNTMVIHCKAGSVEIDAIADLKGFGPVWHHPNGIANCLSLALVSDRHRIALDADVSQTFHAHKLDGSTRRFHRAPCDLCACDASKETGNLFAVTTVEGQEKLFSELDVERAHRARKLQDTMMFPSSSAFLRMIDKNQMLNCQVTRRDVLLAEEILGVNPCAVKGKTVRRQPGHVREEATPIPSTVLNNCGNVTMSVDIFHVSGMKFLRTISRHTMFRATRCIRDAAKATLLACPKATKGLHAQRGFTVVQACGDDEFAPLADELATECHITFAAVARDQHEPCIERDNRTSEERIRCTCAAVPFNRMPPRMVIELVLAVDHWLNCWCSSGGASAAIPPRELLTGMKLDANKHCKFQFGDCVLAHGESDNSMKERAADAACLRTTGSANGSFCVFDLKTARRVHRRSATLAHTTQTAIDRVHAIAEAQAAPIGLTFSDMRNESTILDIDTTDDTGDDDASDADCEPEDDATVETELTGVMTEDEDGLDDHREEDAVDQPHAPTHEPDANDPSDETGEPHTAAETTDGEDDEHVMPADDDEDNGEETHEETQDHVSTDDDDNDQTATEDSDSNDNQLRRSNRDKSKSHPKFCGVPGEGSHTNFFTAGFEHAARHLEMESHEFMLVATAVEQCHNMEASMITPQHGVRKGLKMFGQAGTEAAMKELQQLHDRGVASPVDPRTLTREEVKRAPECLMLLKRKRAGLVKGRGCADGRPQREFISREDASSPTVNTNAFFPSIVIDAIERRAVATADIPGAFLQTDMPKGEIVHLRITGAMARLLMSIDPDLCGPCMIKMKRNGKYEDVMCVRANKAIRGTLRAALLFWEDLSGKLQEWGFEPNPCDPCTVNKIVDGTQCAIIWHVDDSKMSHAKEEAVTAIPNKLQKACGQVAPLTIERGKLHEHLGMTIDHSDEGKVKIAMDDCLRDIMATLPEELRCNGTVDTPAAEHLFAADEDAERLSMKQAAMFHHCVAKLLFAAERGRPDLQTATAFLCTRAKCPDVDDWKKLIRVPACLKETMFLPMILGSDGSGNMHWHVDASFAAHNGMRSHTGAMMTLGQGAAISVSTKQKLNTKSSTEAELVGADDALPFNMWCKHFLQAQGCHAHSTDGKPTDAKLSCLGHRSIPHQDNTSSIQLERCGKASSTKRTRAISIRCFLVTDKLKRGDISTIEHCPTTEMLADCFTKPLQGSLLKRLRNAVLGISDADYLSFKMAYEESRN